MSIKVCDRCGFVPCICDQAKASPNPLISPDTQTRTPRIGADKCEDAIMPFGKHKNKPLTQILVDEPSYLAWVDTNCELRDPFLSSFSEFVKKYEADIEKGVEAKQEAFYRQRHY